MSTTAAQPQPTPAPRRTQRQRREATIARLLDATAATLAEMGYAHASVREICTRAGVSDGGLFRHFDSRLDLIVACAEAVADRTLADLRTWVTSTQPGERTMLAAAMAIRQAARSPANRVWQELLVAARTDDELRRRIEPTTRRYLDDARRLMLSAPPVEGLPPDHQHLWQQLLVHVFNSEALITAVAPDQPDEEGLLHLVTSLRVEP